MATGISLYGNTLFLVYESWLTVFDVSTPSEPVEVYYTSYFNDGEEVIGRNSYAYVGGRYGFDIYNINGSVFPVGHIGTAGSTLNMAVHGNTIFLAHGYEGLTAVNVSNPAEPQIDSVLTVFGYVNSVAVLGNFLYIGTADSGIQVLNIASDGGTG
ncbi:MAG: hypothetical protein IPP40_13100 [bacterium]|nr:hypothetical protein [bacterium]